MSIAGRAFTLAALIAFATPLAARAEVRFDQAKWDPRSPLFVLMDLAPFCDRNAAFWPALSDAPLYVSGQYWFTGDAIRSYTPIVRDLFDREIPVETSEGAPLILQQGFMGFTIYGFTYRIRLGRICDANPGRTFTYGEMLDYLGTLRLAAKPTALSF